MEFVRFAVRLTRATRAAAAGIGVTVALVACGGSPSKEEVEAAKNTVDCQLSGERLLIRYDSGEARLLMPAGDRIVLYQIPSASGVRYSNGNIELRGKGMDLQLSRHGTVTPLERCEPYQLPAK